jgi:hypothetical protein
MNALHSLEEIYCVVKVSDKMRRIERFLIILFLAVLVVGGLSFYADHEEKARYLAVIDSFESQQANAGYVYQVKFHSSTTNYEGTCIESAAERCKRFSAGEKYQFSTLNGRLLFPDSSTASSAFYIETKESIR